MDGSYDFLYNRVLDVTTLIQISVKLFAMYVVVKYTPKNHRYHSYFILNIMIWSFICNLILAFTHLIPLYPAECFRLDGLSSLLINSEAFGHATFLAEVICLTQCTVAIVAAFAYRYIAFAHSYYAPKPARIVWLCCGAHLLSTAFILPLVVQWTVSNDGYPEKTELPEGKFVFCFYPYGHQKIIMLSSYLAFVIVFLFVIIVFSILILMKLRSEKHAFHSKTVALQKKLFSSLLIITAVTLTLGGVPFLICVVVAFFPHLPYARYTVMVCTVILTNHGSVCAVSYLILFKAYRDAAKRIFLKLIRKEKRSNSVINTIHSHVVTK